MAVHVKCRRPYNIEDLKSIMERCGGRGPSPPRCPPMVQACGPSPCQPCSYSPKPCPQPRISKCRDPCGPCPAVAGPVPCMSCPPMLPVPPCPPCPFICPPCTGFPCVTCAPLPKPVPAPCEPLRPVIKIPVNVGGLCYTGTTVCYPCLPKGTLPPVCLPCVPIPGMSVSC